MRLSKYVFLLAVILTMSNFTDALAQTFSFGNQSDNTTATTGNTGLNSIVIGGGGGSWVLKNAGNPDFGHYSELRGIPSLNANLNSILGADMASPNILYTLEFDILFGGGTGEWNTFVGSGSSFAPGYNAPFVGTESFVGIRYVSNSGNITVSLRSGQGWKPSSIVMFPNVPYRVTIVCNNSTEGSFPYTGFNGSNSVGPGRCDIWVNGVLVDNEVARAHPMFAGSNITNFRFYGGNSAAKDFIMLLDNIRQYNNCLVPPQCPKPISLSASNVSQSSASLSWVHNNFSQPVYVTPDSQVIRWRKAGSGSSWTKQTIGGSLTSHSVTGLQISTTYDWEITTYRGEEFYTGTSSFTTASCGVDVYPWTHDFSSNNTCWTTNDVVGTSTNWTFNGSMSSPTLAPVNGTMMARFNARSTTSGDAEMLISPILDMSSLTNPVLEFSHSQDAGFSSRNEDLYVIVSVNNGPFSDTVRSVTRYKAGLPSAAWTLNGADLSAYAGMSNVRLGFLAVSKNGNNLGLDMVRVFNASCPVPGNLTLNNTTQTTANVSWSTVVLSDTFAVMYREVGTNPWTIRLVDNSGGNFSISYTIADLQPGVSYQWRVRTSCGGTIYDYTNSEYFTTDAGCRQAYSLNATGITQTGATLNWTHPSADTFFISYRAVGAPSWSYAYSTTNSHTLTGLTPSTSYQWRVRSKCNGDTMMNYTSAVTFATNSPKTINGSISAATVYPNPTSNSVMLNFHATTEKYTVQVRDNLGRIVRTVSGESVIGNNTIEMDMEQPAGVYILEIQSGGSPQNVKIVVQ